MHQIFFENRLHKQLVIKNGHKIEAGLKIQKLLIRELNVKKKKLDTYIQNWNLGYFKYWFLWKLKMPPWPRKVLFKKWKKLILEKNMLIKKLVVHKKWQERKTSFYIKNDLTFIKKINYKTRWNRLAKIMQRRS